MPRKRRPEALAWLVLALAVLWAAPALADTLTLPQDLVGDVLSETVPSAFAPAAFATQDWGLEWLGAPIPGVRVAIEDGSLQWVRVAEVIALPRARLVVEAESIDAGVVESGKFSQPIVVKESRGTAAVPIALVSNPSNRIHLRVERAGLELDAEIAVRFTPRPSLERPLVYEDPSCSRTQLRARTGGAPGWMYVGCRVLHTQAEEHVTSSLEVFVFWDGVGRTIDVDGVPTPEGAPSLWTLRLRSKPGSVVLRTLPGKDGAEPPGEVLLTYTVPEVVHDGSLGMGIGPYWLTFRNGGAETQHATPMPTLYASYAVSDEVRFVAFDATTLDAQLDTNLGVYLLTTSARGIDRRLRVDIMLGATLIGFRTPGEYHLVPSVPQGVELTYVDFLARRHDLKMGGFVYPVSGSSYYNVWVRWGRSSFFGEVNFISWQATVGGVSFFSRAVGFSLAWPFTMPLVRFL
jgi:hypothetical protein